MISATSIMRPLPVGPVDGIRTAVVTAPGSEPRAPRLMQPLTIAPPKPGAPQLVDALRGAAFQRMLDRLGVTDVSAVTDPTA